jgi:hypothetical protein
MHTATNSIEQREKENIIITSDMRGLVSVVCHDNQ